MIILLSSIIQILHGMIIILAVVVSVGSTSRTVSKCQMSSKISFYPIADFK